MHSDEEDQVTLINTESGGGAVEKEMNIETYAPTDEAGTKHDPVVRIEKLVTEKYEKNSNEGVRGIPGTKSNVPTFTGVDLESIQDVGPRKDYVKEDKTINYEVSRMVEKVKKATGVIRKISVAVVVNKDLSPQERAVLRQTVTVASGIDTERGDQVIITGIKFSTSRYVDLESIEREKSEQDLKRKATIKKFAFLLGTLIVGGVMTIIMLTLMKQSINSDNTEELDKLLDEDEVAILSDIDDKIEEAELAYSKKISLDGNKTITKMKDELQKTIEENPKAVAKSLESYINEVGT
jgi:flagellar M-ring protein FliF